MPYPVAAARGRATEASGGVLQPFLLDWGDFASVLNNTDITFAREFSVSVIAQCAGVRLNLDGPRNMAARLYHVPTATLVASGSVVAAAAGENLLLFSAPAILTPGDLYRVGVYVTAEVDPGTIYFAFAVIHPDGPIVTLTANARCYPSALAGDIYPDAASFSLAAEPIIYA